MSCDKSIDTDSILVVLESAGVAKADQFDALVAVLKLIEAARSKS